MSDKLLVDFPIEGVKRITFNKPDKLNAFDFPMYEEFLDILEKTRWEVKTRVIILTGTGRGFCSGHDISAGGMAGWVENPEELGRMYYGKYSLYKIGSIPAVLRSLPQPVICAVNGTAAGMGLPIAVACDMSIAAQSAKFINSVHNAATGAELGLSYTLPRLVGTQRAAEILLTARPILADEAERIGLVLRTVPDDKLMDAALDIAKNIMVNVPLGIWLTKQSLWANQSIGSLEAALEVESRSVAVAQATEDAKEKRASFIEKRAPSFTFK